MPGLVKMSWIDCINPFRNPVKHGFFRHIPGDKRFAENDKAKICPICWYEAQKLNGTLVQSPRPDNTTSWQKHSQVKASDDLL